MTALETLQKYNLKTDVPSIKERIEKAQKSLFFYAEIAGKVLLIDPMWNSEEEYNEKYASAVELRAADFALLCSLAEKGERRYRPSEHKIELTLEDAWAQVADEAEPFVIRECIDKVDAALLRLESAEKDLFIAKQQESIAYENWQECEKELAEIKGRAESKIAPIAERKERFNKLFDASASGTVFITGEDEKFMGNYFYGDGEKDAEDKELIDFIIKGEGK